MSLSAILYNIKVPHVLLDCSQQEIYSKLFNSISSLRKFNQNIPVIVFVDSKIDFKSYNHLNKYNICDFNDITIIPFEYSYDRGQIFKWKNYIQCFKDFGYKNILCIENSSMFSRDPQQEFINLDSNENWSVKDYSIDGDSCESLFGFRGSRSEVLLLSKNSIDCLTDNFFSEVDSKVLDSQKIASKKLTKKEFYEWRFSAEKFSIESVFAKQTGKSFIEFPSDFVEVGDLSAKIDHKYSGCDFNSCVVCYSEESEYWVPSNLWTCTVKQRINPNHNICHYCCRMIQ